MSRLPTWHLLVMMEKWILEAGDFQIQVGNQVVKVTCNETYKWDTPNKNVLIIVIFQVHRFLFFLISATLLSFHDTTVFLRFSWKV